MTFNYNYASNFYTHNKDKQISFNSLEELEKWALQFEEQLIIDFRSKTIIIYDDYIE